MASAAADRMILALQKLQQQHKADLKLLRDRLAKALLNDDLKEVKLTQSEYDTYVAQGVYFNEPFKECATKMSSSVPRCTQLILDFLRNFKEKVKNDYPKLVKHCLHELFTDVLPDELKKMFDNRRRHTNLTAHDADLLCANIKVLRSSLGNPHFGKIQKDYCHGLVLNLLESKCTKWEELAKESKQIAIAKKKLVIPPHGQQRGQLMLTNKK